MQLFLLILLCLEKIIETSICLYVNKIYSTVDLHVQPCEKWSFPELHRFPYRHAAVLQVSNYNTSNWQQKLWGISKSVFCLQACNKNNNSNNMDKSIQYRVQCHLMVHCQTAWLFVALFVKMLPCFYSYDQVEKANCKSYFQALSSADFSVISSGLSIKTTLWNNARNCLVSVYWWWKPGIFQLFIFVYF